MNFEFFGCPGFYQDSTQKFQNLSQFIENIFENNNHHKRVSKSLCATAQTQITKCHVTFGTHCRCDIESDEFAAQVKEDFAETARNPEARMITPLVLEIIAEKVS